MRSLDLGLNDLDVEGASALASLLATNSSLATLSLRDNLLGPGGAAKIAEALVGNTTLM